MPAERPEDVQRLGDVPTNFGWIEEDKVAGMAMPTSALQLAQLRQQFGVSLVINLLPVDLHRRGVHMLGELAPVLIHFPVGGACTDLLLYRFRSTRFEYFSLARVRRRHRTDRAGGHRSRNEAGGG